jgi:putative Holliday junction resolvase
VLAIDFGTRRLGFAVCDELGVTCRPLETWTRRDSSEDVGRIRHHLDALEIDRVLVGIPTMLDGTSSVATERAAAFAEALSGEIDRPVQTWDEALTSWAADERMAGDGVPRAKQRAMRDAYAALVLLEDYLAAHGATTR